MPAPRKQQTQPRSRGTAKRLSSPATPAGLPAADGDGKEPPPLPEGDYLPETVQAWRALWAEPQAAQLTGAQKLVALRWIEAFEAWLRALRIVKEAPMVSGSMGQPVTNPLMAWVSSREAVMEKCERQLGIGLKNKADLGLTGAQAQLTAAHVNAMYASPGGDDGHELEVAASVEIDEGWVPAE